MSNEVLKAQRRTKIGKNAIKSVRKEHFIPGVLYGHHIENMNINIDEHDFEKYYKKHHIGASLDLDIDGEKTFVLLKDVQYNAMKNMTYHVEFQALAKGEKIKIKVPVHYLNKDKVPAGLIFQELHHEIEMQVLPKDLIEHIEIDIASAHSGGGITVGQLDVYNNEAYEIFEHPDTLLFTISESKVHLEQDPDLETMPADEIPEVGEDM